MQVNLAMAGSLALALATAAPLAAQPVSSNAEANTRLSAEQLEQRREAFGWLLGTWRADHMFGSNSNRSGALITFLLEPDGTVSARLDKMSPWMEGSEERFAAFVGKRFIRGINSNGGSRQVWTHSAGGGIVFDRNTGNWINLGIIYVDRETGKLSNLGAMSDWAHWVKVTSSPSSGPPTTAVASGQPQSGAVADEPSPKVDRSPKKCSYPMYEILAGESMGLVIKRFETDIDEVATYDPDMPAQRMYPNPIAGAAQIPVKYMDFADYRALTRMEEVTEEVVAESGPDKELTRAASQIQRLFKEARQVYNQSAQFADRRGQPCPVFTDPDAHPKIVEADRIVRELRDRREGYLKGRLAAGERLNEKLTRAFYGDLADASDIAEKQRNLIENLQEEAIKSIRSHLSDEEVEPAVIEGLVPRLEALRERYSKLEAEGTEVSDATRDRDLREALKQSGIDYDPALVRSRPVDEKFYIGRAFFEGALVALAPKGTITGQRLLQAHSGFKAVMVTADALNALKNWYSLTVTEDELLPVALAVQENRAYIKGLVSRYEIFEQEYSLLRGNFENSVKEGGALSETE